MFRAILFDLDGTLIDTIDLIVHCFDRVLSDLTGRRWSKEEVIALFGPTEPAIIDRFAPPERRAAACEAFFSCYDAAHDRLAYPFPGVDRVVREAHGRSIRLALERLGVAPAEALYVGDAPSDIVAGQRAGVRTCAATWGRVHETGSLLLAGPDHVCDSLEDLRDLFRH